MSWLLGISRAIDAANERIGRAVAWMVLIAILISAANAISRKAFSISSNAWLELQWYLFGAVFMLGAAWTLRRNEHVRIDIVASRFSKRGRDWLDVVGHCIFLIPFALVHIATSTPFFLSSFRSQEVSTNAGGLIVWPAKFLVLAGFVLLLIQAFSELIKRIAILRGIIPEEELPAAHGSAIPIEELISREDERVRS